MKTIFMIDGGFFIKKYKASKKCRIEADAVSQFVEILNSSYLKQSEFLRAYFYDAMPLKHEIKKPVSKEVVDLGKSDQFLEKQKFLHELKRKNNFSVREGSLRDNGWKLKQASINQLKKGSKTTLEDRDFKMDIQQKGVDMKIGLDIAWASLEKIADKLILVTGDSDFVPAIKFARRAGVQVYLFTLGHGVLPSLLDNADVLIEDTIEDIYNKTI